MEWNYNIDEAPSGRTVQKEVTRKDGKSHTVDVFEKDVVFLASGSCGTVTKSYWIPKESRWNMFATGQVPLAWMEYPTHPKS